MRRLRDQPAAGLTLLLLVSVRPRNKALNAPGDSNKPQNSGRNTTAPASVATSGVCSVSAAREQSADTQCRVARIVTATSTAKFKGDRDTHLGARDRNRLHKSSGHDAQSSDLLEFVLVMRDPGRPVSNSSPSCTTNPNGNSHRIVGRRR